MNAGRGDVDVDAVVAPRVIRDALSVDPHRALPIDGAKVQKRALRRRRDAAAAAAAERKRKAVPHARMKI